MNEQIKLRLLQDIDRYTTAIPQTYYAEITRRNAQAFRSLLLGHRRTMPLWQQMKVLADVCRLYGIQATWSDHTQLCHLHILGAPQAYDETINGQYHFTDTYHGTYTPHALLRDLYTAMQQTQTRFRESFEHHRRTMDPDTRHKFEHCLTHIIPV